MLGISNRSIFVVVLVKMHILRITTYQGKYQSHLQFLEVEISLA